MKPSVGDVVRCVHGSYHLQITMGEKYIIVGISYKNSWQYDVLIVDDDGDKIWLPGELCFECV